MPASDVEWPQFFSYPPYFTLQPNEESRQKQLQLWRKLVVQYCATTKSSRDAHTKLCWEAGGPSPDCGVQTFELNLDQEDSPIFSNPAIDRTLNRKGRVLVCEGLVQAEQALWLPPEKEKQRCLVTRQPLRVWANTILDVVNTRLTSKAMTVDNLYSGEDVQGTELEGLPHGLVMRALKLLKSDGKVACALPLHALAVRLFSLDDGSGAVGVKFQ